MADLIVNGYNVGTELQQVILLPDTGVVIPVERVGHLKEINVTQQSTATTCMPVIYNGRRLHRNIYHDWAGRLTFTRFNGDITNLINGIMNRFQQTGQETYFSIFATIFNTILNTEDEYLWHRCVLNDHDWGTMNGSSEVDQSLAFRCQSLAITGNNNNILFNGPSIGAGALVA